MFMTNFNEESCGMAIRFILEKNVLPSKFKPKHLTIMINSPGGEVPHAFALIDVMKGSAIPVRTIGLGMIASCGVLTFMAGQKGHRIITPNTSILSHQYSWGSRGKEHELFAVVREFEMSTERMLTHYKKCTGLSEKKIREERTNTAQKMIIAPIIRQIKDHKRIKQEEAAASASTD